MASRRRAHISPFRRSTGSGQPRRRRPLLGLTAGDPIADGEVDGSGVRGASEMTAILPPDSSPPHRRQKPASVDRRRARSPWHGWWVDVAAPCALLHHLDHDVSGVGGESLEVGPISGEDGASGLGQRDQERIDG